MAADLSHLPSVDKIKHKYEETVKVNLKDMSWVLHVVCVVFTSLEWTCPSFPLGEIGTFALFKLPMFLWGTFIKIKII